MIVSFDKEIERLRAAGAVIPEDKALAVAMERFMVYDQGFAAGREHAVRVVQRKATNPMMIVNEIRRPIR